MVGVTVVRNEAEAEVVCGMLRSNGIACGYEQTNFGAGATDGYPLGGPVEIFVGEDDERRARELLRPDREGER
jgi:hypothetical protein